MSLTPSFSDFPTAPGFSRDRATASSMGLMPVLPAPDASSPPVDRRSAEPGSRSGRAGVERRQFGSSHSGLSEEGRELASAIDHYKLQHHRRYITCDEMLLVLRSLGYDKLPASE